MTETRTNSTQPRTPLDWLIRFFLEQKLVVVIVTLLLVGWGVAVAPFDWEIGWLPRDPVPVDAIPNYGENQQIVFTEWPGRSPQDIEDQVTYPLTVNLMGVPNVKEVRSQSSFGFSMIFIIFNEDAGWEWSRDRIIEKLNSLPAGTLPEQVAPSLGPDATALGQVFWYTLEGRDPDGEPTGGWDLQELRRAQDWYVRYGLLGAEGITEVASIGGFVPEYQVEVDPDAMRVHGVKLGQVLAAVRDSNLDVGAGVTEINRVEYVIRGVGFVEELEDIERAVVDVREGNVPIYVRDVANVSRSPAPRRGALTVGGAEAVGGVTVVREGYNPLAAIHNVKQKIREISPGMPAKAVIDWSNIDREGVRQFAAAEGFEAFASPEIDHEAWVDWLRSTPRDQWPEWVTLSQLEVVPFYDRTDLIYRTLGTLNDALVQQVLVTIVVVVLLVMHLRSGLLISMMLPLAVLMAFIMMKMFAVDANVVALAGIAIAIGTIVDMGVIVTENVLRHLREAPREEPRLEVVYRGTREVGSAILTAIATTVVSFLPVFAMSGAEGKLFIPLAYTKTFVLVASVFVALTIVPAAVHVVIANRFEGRRIGKLLLAGLALSAGVVVAVGIAQGWLWVWVAGLLLLAAAVYRLLADHLPGVAGRLGPRWGAAAEVGARELRRWGPWVASVTAAVAVAWVLARVWEPLGPEAGVVSNFIFVVLMIGGLLGLFGLFMWAYVPLLRMALRFKAVFLLLPLLLMVFGFGYVWLGPTQFFGPLDRASADTFAESSDAETLIEEGLLVRRGENLYWSDTALAVDRADMATMLRNYDVAHADAVLEDWQRRKDWVALSRMSGEEAAGEPWVTQLQWKVTQEWDGLDKEFMPDLDEGAFLWMPSISYHGSIGEALDVLRFQDQAIAAVPEVEGVYGKIGRAETALDPAPVGMIETVVNYKSEYITDSAGRRITFAYDEETGEFLRDEDGELIVDNSGEGRPFRQWRDHIQSPEDIWAEMERAADIPGVTGVSLLQPIETRQLMLQTGMRASMGVKVRGPDLPTLERMVLQIERLLREAPGVNASSVSADRVVGKPYLEIHPDREAIARFGLNIADVQKVIATAIGGTTVTSTVEGRERYGVRVRYPRELRQEIDQMERIVVPASDGAHIPLAQLAEIRYARGPQMIRSEDTFLTAYVFFGAERGLAEVEVVEQARRHLDDAVATGELAVPQGVSWRFAGSYEHQVRAVRTLSVVIPVALMIIFLILYFQFASVLTTLIVFSGIAVAWAGGFVMIYLYGQEWFGDFEMFGRNMRDVFQIGPVNLSVAVWVGFLALFGIAVDNGVVIATYLRQYFAQEQPGTIEAIREATVHAGHRRLRPCLMTTATTILALLPVLTSTGTGADIMIPMAIPSVGGMVFVLLTMFSVPVLYSLVAELRLRATSRGG